MSSETRSLWEQFDSEVELWRRGRLFLIFIGLFQFLTQAIVIMAAAFLGNLERAAGLAAGALLFWLLFYFVWTGVHWVRWLWGAWNLVVGFCLLIWAWRDMSDMETLSGTLTFGIGFVLCFSPSIYFFALRQREVVRWREAFLIAVVCFLLLLSVGATLAGLVILRQRWNRDTTAFAIEANHRIYHDRDYDWVRARVTASSFQNHGAERLRYFFEDNRDRLGQVGPVTEPRTMINLRLQWPLELTATVRFDAKASTARGPVAVHEILQGGAGGWQIDHIWWTYLPMTEAGPAG